MYQRSPGGKVIALFEHLIYHHCRWCVPARHFGLCEEFQSIRVMILLYLRNTCLDSLLIIRWAVEFGPPNLERPFLIYVAGLQTLCI